MKNKYLLILFVVLLIVYAGITLFGDKKESSFNDKIADFDVEDVDLIKIFPKEKSTKEFSLQKNDNNWIAVDNDKSYVADNSMVENALNSLKNMKIKNIITKNPDKFEKYELEDGKCKEIQVFSNKKKLVDLLIGKFKFDQQTRTASSYVRLAGENKVYSTDGFSSINISDNISTYRNKNLVSFNPDNLTEIKYFHDNTTDELTKQGKDWTHGNIVVDSTKIAGFLTSLSNIKGSKFVNLNNNWHRPESYDSLVLYMQDKDISIVAYPDSTISSGFIIHGSENEGAFFDSDSTGLFKRIFSKFEDIIR